MVNVVMIVLICIFVFGEGDVGIDLGFLGSGEVGFGSVGVGGGCFVFFLWGCCCILVVEMVVLWNWNIVLRMGLWVGIKFGRCGWVGMKVGGGV